MRALIVLACACSRGGSDPPAVAVTQVGGSAAEAPVPAHVTDALAAAKDDAKLAGARCGELFHQLEAGYCYQGNGDPAKAIELGPSALAGKPGVLYFEVECERVQPDGHTSMSCLFRPSGDYAKFHPDAAYTLGPGAEGFNFNLIPPELGAGILVGHGKNAFPYRVHVAAKLSERDYVHVDATLAATPTPR